MGSPQIVTEGPAHVRIASANIYDKLPIDLATVALGRVLAQADLAGLQEWSTRERNKAIADAGRLIQLPLTRATVRPVKSRQGWTWVRPVFGGVPIGARASKWVPVRCRGAVLAGPSKVESQGKRESWQGPSRATVSVWRHIRTGERISVINCHITAGSQAGKGGYRKDSPKRAARHRREVASLRRLAIAHGQLRRTFIVGDFNFHELEIPPLISCWDGRPNVGTLGNRAVDQIHAPKRADRAFTITHRGDHKAAVAIYRAQEKP